MVTMLALRRDVRKGQIHFPEHGQHPRCHRLYRHHHCPVATFTVPRMPTLIRTLRILHTVPHGTPHPLPTSHPRSLRMVEQRLATAALRYRILILTRRHMVYHRPTIRI